MENVDVFLRIWKKQMALKWGDKINDLANNHFRLIKFLETTKVKHMFRDQFKHTNTA